MAVLVTAFLVLLQGEFNLKCAAIASAFVFTLVGIWFPSQMADVLNRNRGDDTYASVRFTPTSALSASWTCFFLAPILFYFWFD